MIKILFVCHGNICRSPMAEFVMKDMVRKAGLQDQFYIASSAVSAEEIGNPVHNGTTRKLSEYGISTEGKRAVQLQKSDYEKYDLLIGMDHRNLEQMKRMAGAGQRQKLYRLLDFCDKSGDIADPWYTGDFDQTYADVSAGCKCLLEYLKTIIL